MWMIPFGKIAITDILSIKRTHNPLSAPAASLKRLSIYSVKSKCSGFLISPVHEQELLDTLKAINPDINMQVPDRKGKRRIWDWNI